MLKISKIVKSGHVSREHHEIVLNKIKKYIHNEKFDIYTYNTDNFFKSDPNFLRENLCGFSKIDIVSRESDVGLCSAVRDSCVFSP